MEIIDGKKVAQAIKQQVKVEIDNLISLGKRVPGLVTILVGDNPASLSYINSKSKACIELGMKSIVNRLDRNITQTELINLIKKYNNDDEIDGILVQLPLPSHIDEDEVINTIFPSKDVDGFHPINVGKLVIGKETFLPCTPAGIVELLKYYNIPTQGKHVVVLGRSNIVGKPIANILLQKNEFANAIVTVCHSAAKDLRQFTTKADILIAAIGKPNFVTKEMVKDGVVIIDVGINRIDDNSNPKGYKNVGDVDFNSVAEKCSYITPVPGGVGLMTIAMLMKNTLKSYLLNTGK